MSHVLGEEESIQLSVAEARELWDCMRQLGGELGDVEDADLDPVEWSPLVVRALPAHLLRAMYRFRGRGSAHDAVLVRGLLPDDLEIEPTPTVPGPRAATTPLIERCLLGVVSLLGEPFGFKSLREGRLVQYVAPVPGQQDAQTAEGAVALDWHTEDSFSPDRPDYVVLLCVRQDETAVTQFTAVKTMNLDPELWRILRQPRFTLRPGPEYGTIRSNGSATPVISGPEADPETCYNSVYTTPSDSADEQASVALRTFKDGLAPAAVGHVMRRGDLLVLDNLRVVHARTPFQARFDGTDRWLMRAVICSSFRQHRRRSGVRVVSGENGQPAAVIS